MNIRPYKKSDWKRLCEIHDAARMDELRGSVNLAAFKSLENSAEEDGLFNDELWIGEINNQIVGFIAFSKEEITWLYIAPKEYRKGYGSQLLDFVLDTVEESIQTDVLSGNKSALALYLKKGFKILEKKKGKLGGNESFSVEGYVMEYSTRRNL